METSSHKMAAGNGGSFIQDYLMESDSDEGEFSRFAEGNARNIMQVCGKEESNSECEIDIEGSQRAPNGYSRGWLVDFIESGECA